MIRHSLMIRASAGTGKTYQLAHRFLALLALGEDPSRIIALTFTRKAAGEFADRILGSLAKGAASADGAAELASRLQSVLRGDPAQAQPALIDPEDELPPMDQARFRALLEIVVRGLDRLALGTIDSFFTRIARTSWSDLGLTGFAMLEEADLAAEKDRVFTRIFSRMGECAGRESFLQAFKLATFGVEENRFVETLENFIGDYHGRFLESPDEDVWGGGTRLWPQGSPWPAFDFASFRADAGRLAEISADRDWGHKSWQGSWDKLMGVLETYEPGNIGADLPLAKQLLPNLADLLAGEAEIEYSKKQIAFRGELATLTGTLLARCIGAEIRLRLTQTGGLHKVMRRYEDAYRRDVRGRGMLGFTDLTMVLAAAEIGKRGIGQNIGYRLDQWFDHWMLDEFQDTNRLQWDVLSGLIQEVQQDDEGKRTFFVVGDPKQGIHAWRGGEPRLFDEIARDWQGSLPEWCMDKSRRSTQAVLDLVNQICDPAGPAMTGMFQADALARWKFSRHQAANPLPGEAMVLEVGDATDDGGAADDAGTRDDDDRSSRKPTWPGVVALLAEYTPLARGQTCAVLVQSNKSARELADFLRNAMPDLQVEVETETPMENDGPLAAMLLDFFRWLHTPADRMAWGHLAYSPMRAALSAAFAADEEPVLWHTVRALIHADGITAVLDKLAAAIRASGPLDAFNASRLEAWELEARMFDARGGTLKDWLGFLAAWKVREYSQAGAIQIMTVHKAKGLEFDMVILPDLAGSAFDHGGKIDMLRERTGDGVTRFLTLAPPALFVDADARLRGMRDVWSAEQSYERFCNFYVAMTRAKHGLFLIVPEYKAPRDGKKTRTYASWLHEAMAGQPAPAATTIPGVPNLKVLWSRGDNTWLRPESPGTEIAIPPAITLRAPVPRPRRQTPSGAKLDNATKSGNARHDRRGAMAFGTAVHAAFEAIGWLDDSAPPDHPDPRVDAVRARCLAAPAIRALFTRPAGSVEVWREQPFDQINDGAWTSGVMDRVHIHRVDGAAARATIIDFKTDTVEDPATLADRYGMQMHAYRDALARILALPPGAISCLLLSTSHATLIPVP